MSLLRLAYPATILYIFYACYACYAYYARVQLTMRFEKPNINRSFEGVARGLHLTTNQKFRDLIFQSFGHECLLGSDVFADLRHCYVFDLDFFRLRVLYFHHLAWRKLLNPFKWVEFFLVLPFELLSHGLITLLHFLTNICRSYFYDDKDRLKQESLKWLASTVNWVLIFLQDLTLVVHGLLQLVITIIRSLLSPSCYLVRPAIETAKKNPRIFKAIVGLTMALSVGVLILFLGGWLPPALLVLAGGMIAVKLLKLALVSLVVGSFLTKTFNCIKDLKILGQEQSSIKIQKDNFKRRGKFFHSPRARRYPLSFITSEKAPFLYYRENKETHKMPAVFYWKVDSSTTEVFFINNATSRTSFTTSRPQEYINILRGNDQNPKIYPRHIYEDIRKVCPLMPSKIRKTGKLSRNLHQIDTDNTVLREIHRQDWRYTLALMTGTESLFYPIARTPSR